MHRSLVFQLAPSLLVGAALTALIFVNETNQPVPEAGLLWALPGVWAMIYGLGLFQCSRNLPRPTAWVAAYFLISGLAVIVGSQLGWPMDHLQMVATFGVGQLLLSAVLFWNLERTRGNQ
jgi:hydrogenase/urease accessory protein HupE